MVVLLTTQEMQAQLLRLADELECNMVQAHNLYGRMSMSEQIPAYIEGPTLEIGGVYSTIECAYLTMLHELGHVAHKHTYMCPRGQNKKFYLENGVLRSEAEAWEWALDQAGCLITTKERRFMWWCLGSYYFGENKTDNDEYFYSIRDRILDNE